MDSVELQQAADRIERQLTSPMVPLIVWAAIVGAFVYLSFLLRPGYRGDSLPYAMVLVAESYVVVQGLLTFWTILGSRFFNPRNFEYHRPKTGCLPRRSARARLRFCAAKILRLRGKSKCTCTTVR
jgi:hypothetical protein